MGKNVMNWKVVGVISGEKNVIGLFMVKFWY